MLLGIKNDNYEREDKRNMAEFEFTPWVCVYGWLMYLIGFVAGRLSIRK